MQSIIGFFWGLYITSPISTSIGELLSLVYAAHVIFNRKKLYISKPIKSVLILLLCCAFLQLISDVFNGTELITSMKGVFAYIFLTAAIITLTDILKTPYEFRKFLFGFCISSCIYFFITRIDSSIYLVWKSSFAIYFTILVFYIAEKFSSNCRIVFLLGLLCSSVFSIYADFRSAFFVFSMVFIVLLFPGFARKVGLMMSNNYLAGIVSLVLVAVLINSIATLLTLTFSEEIGKVNQIAMLKYKAQAGGDFGLLLGGRPEILASINAIVEKPFFGFGSWPVDSFGKYSDIHSAAMKFNYDFSDFISSEVIANDRLIPSHSHIVQGFVWGGISLGILWLLIFFILAKEILKSYSGENFDVYFTVITLYFVWNVWFSPFSFIHRIGMGLAICLIASYSNSIFSTQIRNENSLRLQS